MMADFLEFNDISQEFKGAMNGGRLKLHKQGVVFKNNRTGKVEQVHLEDLDKTKWLRAARGHELKLYMKNGTIFRYDGFKEGDYDRLSDYIKKNYNLSLEEVELSLKGWNWGEAKFKGSEMSFNVDNKAAFNIPLNNVSHSAIGKNEITIEFHQNDDAAVSLMEMRFFVPPTDGESDPIEEFHKSVLAKADIIQATGDAIATFTEIPCLTPRGRYDVKIYPSFLQLHGKTFDYKIPYTTVLRLFLLPHKDQRQMFFVMSLDPPIKQGQTRYQHIILSFNKEDEVSMTLNLTDEDVEQKFEGKLQKEMSGVLFEIVSRIMKALVNRKITVPGNFKGKSGTSAISCSYKSNSGFLYPLERGVIFVHKPPLHIRFDEISCVNFARGTGSSRYFDFEIETTSASQYVFSSIEKDEYSKLYDFVSTKRLKIKNVGMKRGDVGEYDDLIGSDDEDAHDAYLEHVKAEGREREDYESESDESSDESFNPGDSSSVAEEYDSNAMSSESGEEGGSDSEAKKKKEKKEKKKTKTVSEKPRKKRKKQQKDPNKPKRPATAYFLFLNENREKIKEKQPGMSVAEVTKKGGEMWSSMTDKDKEKYVARAKVLKAEYEVAMQEYNARPQEDDDEGGSDTATPTKQKRSKPKTKQVQKSPSKAGSGTNYKSKEYISSESSDSSVSSDDKPLKPKSKSKKSKDDEDDDLPSEEEILSTPPSSSGDEKSDASEEEDESDEDDD